MMGKTHVVWGVSTWLAATAPLAVWRPALVVPVAAAGVVVTPFTSAGRGSPDVDRVWAPGRGGLHHWRNHRGFTHRVWFASLLTVVGVAVCAVLPPPGWLVVTAALWGWWSGTWVVTCCSGG